MTEEGTTKQQDEMYCSSCGALVKKDVQFCPQCGARAGAAPGAVPPTAGIGATGAGADAAAAGLYPVRLEADYPERLSRLLIFVKWWLFVIPHSFVLYFYTLLVEYSAILFIPFTGLAVLITGRYPRWLWGWYVHYIRWYLRVAAYQYLLTDKYPPFNGNPDSPYDVRFDIEYPDRMNRLLWLVKWILVIPHYIVLIFLSLAVFVVWIIAWWAILFTGRYPRGLFDFTVGVLRWGARVIAYTFWLRDEYPPFSFD